MTFITKIEAMSFLNNNSSTKTVIFFIKTLPTVPKCVFGMNNAAMQNICFLVETRDPGKYQPFEVLTLIE